jgi:hypothetical protein
MDYAPIIEECYDAPTKTNGRYVTECVQCGFVFELQWERRFSIHVNTPEHEYRRYALLKNGILVFPDEFEEHSDMRDYRAWMPCPAYRGDDITLTTEQLKKSEFKTIDDGKSAGQCSRQMCEKEDYRTLWFVPDFWKAVVQYERRLRRQEKQKSL